MCCTNENTISHAKQNANSTTIQSIDCDKQITHIQNRLDGQMWMERQPKNNIMLSKERRCAATAVRVQPNTILRCISRMILSKSLENKFVNARTHCTWLRWVHHLNFVFMEIGVIGSSNLKVLLFCFCYRMHSKCESRIFDRRMRMKMHSKWIKICWCKWNIRFPDGFVARRNVYQSAKVLRRFSFGSKLPHVVLVALMLVSYGGIECYMGAPNDSIMPNGFGSNYHSVQYSLTAK